jgi:hypothetical protein
MIGDSLFFQAHNETSTRRELSKEDGSGKKKSVGSDEICKITPGRWECLPFITRSGFCELSLPQNLGTGHSDDHETLIRSKNSKSLSNRSATPAF